MSDAGSGNTPSAVGRVGVGSVVRISQGQRLWLGAFARDTGEPRRSVQVRLFVIQARAAGGEPKVLASGVGPVPLTAAQYERVERAFVRPGRDISP